MLYNKSLVVCRGWVKSNISVETAAVTRTHKRQHKTHRIRSDYYILSRIGTRYLNRDFRADSTIIIIIIIIIFKTVQKYFTFISYVYDDTDYGILSVSYRFSNGHPHF